ncbi:MAG: MFS transporter, partial [Actinomycetota bacterium]|nr:MFS transporter [Actinomycetota bacterium]
MRQDVRTRALVPVLLFVGTVVALVSSLGAPLVPTIAEVDDVSLAAAQWSLTVSLLVGAVATPALGRLGDGPRRKQVVVAVLLAVLAGCVLAALPLGFEALLAGRALQGLGLGLTPLAMAVAREALPPDRARSAVAMLSVTTVAGVGIGYPLTGLVTDVFGLHGGFWSAAAISGAAALLAAGVLPASRGEARGRD